MKTKEQNKYIKCPRCNSIKYEKESPYTCKHCKLTVIPLAVLNKINKLKEN